MRRDDRRKEIMDLLVKQGSVKLEELAESFAVSKMTIHRDLDDLESEGLLRKIRGGASVESSSDFESDFRFREQLNVSEKTSIAQAALSLIEPGMTVAINDGTTASLLAAMLPDKRPLTVITNNRAAAEALINQSGITLITLGGTYSAKFNGFFGLLAEGSLAQVRADIAFISSPAVFGVKAFHMDQEPIRTKRLMMEAASKVYLMVDHQKFDCSALHFLANLNNFDGVITDRGIDSLRATSLKDEGINLILAS